MSKQINYSRNKRTLTISWEILAFGRDVIKKDDKNPLRNIESSVFPALEPYFPPAIISLGHERQEVIIIIIRSQTGRWAERRLKN